jgi:hypothetical protein
MEKIDEVFYFDRSNATFFSIHIADYFLVDDTADKSSHHNGNVKLITEWIKRIENDDPAIIEIPRLQLTSNKKQRSEAEKFLLKWEINVQEASICDLDWML